jgi:hypothetical protein
MQVAAATPAGVARALLQSTPHAHDLELLHVLPTSVWLSAQSPALSEVYGLCARRLFSSSCSCCQLCRH